LSSTDFDSPDELDAATDCDSSDESFQSDTSATPEQRDAPFAGDRGTLPLETRRVLVQLLNGPFIDGKRQSNQWRVLHRDETTLRSRLHELFLELIVAPDEMIAFVRAADTGDMEVPILLRRVSLTYLETVLVLFLRQQLIHAQTRGERAAISKSEITEHLRVYERTDNVDRARFGRQMEAAIVKVNKHNLLRKLRSDDRFEISPVLQILFTAEEITELTAAYQTLVATPKPAGSLEGMRVELDEILAGEMGTVEDEACSSEDLDAADATQKGDVR